MSTHASERHEQRPHLDLWLVAVVGLAAALVALGSWVLIDRFGGAGSDSAISVIDDFVASVNADDTDALATVVTADAEFTDGTGAGQWLLAWGGETFVQGWTMERVAPVDLEGDFATTWMRLTPSEVPVDVGRDPIDLPYGVPPSELIENPQLVVWQIEDGKVRAAWAFIPGFTPPLHNAELPAR